MNVKILQSKQHKKLFIPIILVIMACLFALPTNLKAQAENEDVQWNFIQETSGVKFYYQKGVCNNQKILFLKIVNDSDVKVAGSWQISIDASPRNLILTDVLMPIEAGSEVVGGCDSIYPHMNVQIDWSTYEFHKLTVVAELD